MGSPQRNGTGDAVLVETAVGSMSTRLWIGIAATPNFGAGQASVYFDDTACPATATRGPIAGSAKIFS